MGRRVDLQYLLEDILGSKNVYFQPPESMKLQFPAIVYELDAINSNHADNNPYVSQKRYEITLVDCNPDSRFVDALAALPTCRFDRQFKSENLNHFMFSLYF